MTYLSRLKDWLVAEMPPELEALDERLRVNEVRYHPLVSMLIILGLSVISWGLLLSCVATVRRMLG